MSRLLCLLPRHRLTQMREIYNDDLSPDTPEAKPDIFHCLSACGQPNVFNFRTLIPSRSGTFAFVCVFECTILRSSFGSVNILLEYFFGCNYFSRVFPPIQHGCLFVLLFAISVCMIKVGFVYAYFHARDNIVSKRVVAATKIIKKLVNTKYY